MERMSDERIELCALNIYPMSEVVAEARRARDAEIARLGAVRDDMAEFINREHPGMAHRWMRAKFTP